MKNYDFIVVGAGLFGAVFAYEARQAGKRCLVIDRRAHIGGNCYTREQGGIHINEYGAHIFRTDDKKVWDYMRRFCTFNHFVNSPIANYHGELYNMPFNMNTFNKLWGVVSPEQARAKIASQCEPPQGGSVTNLEEHVLSLVGRDIYEKLIKGYTEKQWGCPCTELPPSIMRRLPIRYKYDNNYYHDRYQGMPIGGYTAIFEKLLEGIDLELEVDFSEIDAGDSMVIYTGAIDEYYAQCYGELAYRSLRFEHEELDIPNYQGVAVMNFTDIETPYTRIIEHKHFEFLDDREEAEGGTMLRTIISREYSLACAAGAEPYYPMEDEENLALYASYKELAKKTPRVIFGGRLGEYRYYDMQDTIKSALALAGRLL